MLQYLAKAFLEMVVPPFCYYCHEFAVQADVHEPLCARCKSLVRPVISQEIKVTSSTVMKVFAVGAYEEPLKTLVLAKNNGSTFAAKQLGLLMVETIPLQALLCDILVPIPLHWTRYAKRGFNQAEVIAHEVGNCLAKPVLNVLKRVKRTYFQSSVPSHQRVKNVEEAFALNAKSGLLKGKHLVLVDDLMTTGATLRTAAHILDDQGPASISAIVACRVI